MQRQRNQEWEPGRDMSTPKCFYFLVFWTGEERLTDFWNKTAKAKRKDMSANSLKKKNSSRSCTEAERFGYSAERARFRFSFMSWFHYPEESLVPRTKPGFVAPPRQSLRDARIIRQMRLTYHIRFQVMPDNWSSHCSCTVVEYILSFRAECSGCWPLLGVQLKHHAGRTQSSCHRPIWYLQASPVRPI